MTKSAFLQRVANALRPESPAPVQEYSVEALAQAANTTVRNVRAYQDKGLLEPPLRRGRVGVYNAQHLQRLQLIGQLLARGYSMVSIRELLEACEQGQGLADVLGLNNALSAPGGAELAAQMDFAQLQSLFSETLSDELIERTMSLGLLQFAGDHLKVPSPKLLAAGVALHHEGIALRVLLDQLSAIRQHVERIAGGIVAMIAAELVSDEGQGALPRADQLEPLNQQLQRLRPLLEQVVEAELARSLPLAVDQELNARLAKLLTSQ